MKVKFKKTLPNIITISRLVSLMVGFILFIKDKFILSIAFYIYGAISDAFDGYFARKYDAYSKLGKFLDAISDKLYALSLIILSIINGNYIIIIPAFFEIVIAIISYFNLKKNKVTYTERVGKIKTSIMFPMMIVSILSVKIKSLYYLFILLLLLSIYFQIQSIIAYINQLNGKSIESIINYKDKSVKEKTVLLVKEFIYYLFHPILKIK